ncbi:LysM peptidoglycan-binding domain-containing protein [Bacillus testis]|uniref:LysM peptidoglycan-binding domain-containing protein n=1 Tax=Bacillus testis TaxID=1622072 RepID=UPI00067EFF18|nr:LysM domain-containing protein [Bacillus testis]
MKRLVFLGLALLFIYSSYIDLTKGTLPRKSPSSVETKETMASIPYIEVEVQPGDTLLSIMEDQEGTLNKPIETIMADFEKLNSGVSPRELQIGKTYKFPAYM